MQYSLCHSILQISFNVLDLDRILAVNHQGCLHREIEIGKETEIERGIEKEIVIVIVTVIATAIVIASGIEIATYCLDIDRQSDHLQGMSHIIFTIV